MAFLLGTRGITISQEDNSFTKPADYHIYRRDTGVKCPNESCVSNQETEVRYIKPEFKIVSIKPLTLRCVYCEHELHPQYIASSDWHEGRLESKKYHRADSRWIRRIKPENLIIFNSDSEAQAWGFKPSDFVTQHND